MRGWRWNHLLLVLWPWCTLLVGALSKRVRECEMVYFFAVPTIEENRGAERPYSQFDGLKRIGFVLVVSIL